MDHFRSLSHSVTCFLYPYGNILGHKYILFENERANGPVAHASIIQGPGMRVTNYRIEWSCEEMRLKSLYIVNGRNKKKFKKNWWE